MNFATGNGSRGSVLPQTAFIPVPGGGRVFARRYYPEGGAAGQWTRASGWDASDGEVARHLLL